MSGKKELPLAELKNGVAPPLGLSFSDLIVNSEWGDARPEIDATSGSIKGVTKRGHNGMDFKASIGTRVNSTMDGTILYVDKEGTLSTYGKVIVIKHRNGNNSLYALLSDISVNEGDLVVAGQFIGSSGETGLCDGPHLHFGYDGNGDGLFQRDNSVDNPARLLYSGE
ncbi:MAG: M23 family metallopeptidase [Treponema sp.]